MHISTPLNVANYTKTPHFHSSTTEAKICVCELKSQMRYCNVRWTCVASGVANRNSKHPVFIGVLARSAVRSSLPTRKRPFSGMAPPCGPRPLRLICNFRWTPSLEDRVTGSPACLQPAGLRPSYGRHAALRHDDMLPAALPTQFLHGLVRDLLLVDELPRPCDDLLRDVGD